MCGIPMLPPREPDATKGRKLTFEQAAAHIGGAGQLVSENGYRLIRLNAKQYLWKYPNKTTWCTACDKPIQGFYGNHGRMYACPVCGARCEFRYAAKGHGRCYDEFYLYEWRRSVLDDETIVLTGAIVYRDSTKEQPHLARLNIDASAIYVFRPGEAVTVYKRRWYYADGGKGRWEQQKGVYPEHTRYGGAKLEIVMDHLEFRQAIEGTRIGRLFDLLREQSGRWQDLELTAIASCARRPWLEYLYKSGQRYLAGQLMRAERVSRDVVPRQRARKPRELLGLTEAQWFEVRRDGISLTENTLRTLRLLQILDIGPVKVADAMEMAAKTDVAWHIEEEILPRRKRYAYEAPNICERLARLPDKPRRKILRRILADIRHAREWKDYYGQLARLGEAPTEGDAFTPEADMALLLPKDMHAMHQRMTDRENALEAERQAKKLAKKQTDLEGRLEALRRKHSFTACGLVLRPYESCEEVIREGQRLHICIGGYADSYAEGRTVICCLRKADAPDVSWRAVEFGKNGMRLQDRGAYNDTHGGIPEDEKELLRRFWAAFDKAHEHDRRKERASA